MATELGSRQFIDRLLPAPREGGFRLPDHWVWCGSPIRGEDGRYHLFASRWPREYPFFLGYVTNSEVVRAVSDSPAGPYELAEVVLPARGREHWDGMMTHNPTIHRYGSQYLLFYIGATYQGPKPTADELWRGERGATNECYNNIRIGLATAPSLAGPWTRRPEPVLRPRPGKWDGTVVTNPAPCVLDDGGLMMLYRSNTPDGLRLGAAVADNPDAPFERLADEPVLASNKQSYVEDPYLWQEDGRLHLLAKDWTGGFTGEKGAGCYSSSADGVSWPRPIKAYSRTVRWNDGSTSTLGAAERPQLLLQDGLPTHLVLASTEGELSWTGLPTEFDRSGRTWSMVIPLA